LKSPNDLIDVPAAAIVARETGGEIRFSLSQAVREKPSDGFAVPRTLDPHRVGQETFLAERQWPPFEPSGDGNDLPVCSFLVHGARI
jgi:hypothetical protein